MPLRALLPDICCAFAKCAVVGLAPEDTAEFENYCYIWNAGPKDWSAPFRNHPDGLGATLDDRARERLNRANAVREAVLPPLERFRQAVREADGPGFAAAVYDLLMAVDAPDHIRALCAQAGSEEEAARALEREDRAWEALMGLLDTLAAVIGPRRLSLPVLRSLFLSGAAGISLGEIPRPWTRSSSALPTVSVPPGSARPMSSVPVPASFPPPAVLPASLERGNAGR